MNEVYRHFLKIYFRGASVSVGFYAQRCDASSQEPSVAFRCPPSHSSWTPSRSSQTMVPFPSETEQSEMFKPSSASEENRTIRPLISKRPTQPRNDGNPLRTSAEEVHFVPPKTVRTRSPHYGNSFPIACLTRNLPSLKTIPRIAYTQDNS